MDSDKELDIETRYHLMWCSYYFILFIALIYFRFCYTYFVAVVEIPFHLMPFPLCLFLFVFVVAAVIRMNKKAQLIFFYSPQENIIIYPYYLLVDYKVFFFSPFFRLFLLLGHSFQPDSVSISDVRFIFIPLQSINSFSRINI